MTRSATHPNWIAPSLIPVNLVCGPPAAGKTTFATIHAEPGDIILDLDAIVAQLSGEPLTHNWHDAWLNPALAERNTRLASLSRPSQWQRAWLIVGEPKPTARRWWRTTLGPGNTYVVATPLDVCIARIARDAQRNQVAQRQAQAAALWWRTYRPALGDTLIRDHDAALHLSQPAMAQPAPQSAQA